MRLFVQRSDVGEFRRRYRWMVLVVLGAFVALIGRLGEDAVAAAALALWMGDLARRAWPRR